MFSPVAEHVSIPKQRDPEVTRGNGAKTERPMGRAFSPHGLWDAPLSRGDTPGWYGDAPLALEEWFLSVLVVLAPGE